LALILPSHPPPPAGTPSLISLPLLEQLLAALDARFGIAAGAEISIEADPGTFDADRLHGYMRLGVTRVSVGVQVRGTSGG
jgi:oxygen-independent coproporphyrinogen-3 oxidase